MSGRRTMRTAAAFFLLAAAFLLLFLLNVGVGSMRIAPAEIVRVLLGGEQGARSYQVIMKLRLPRAVAAAMMGGALSVSGYLLQTYFRNPIAGPYVMGISSGARMVVGIVMIWGMKLFGSVHFTALMLAAFAGSMLCTGLILTMSRQIRSMAMLMVVGVMIGNICQAATDFLVTFAEDADIANLHAWSQGSFSAVSWTQLGPCCMVVICALGACTLMAKPIGAYALGENYAASMGVNVKRFRIALIVVSSLLSSCVTALSGPISFVGIAAPHMTRRLFGTDRPQIILPGAFLLGAVFCMVCDLIARTAFSPTELAISSVTAALGAPIVIGQMLKRGRRDV